jgi:mRNA-degrading endonuclease RelE of RelBE toxin-antitoxin system
MSWDFLLSSDAAKSLRRMGARDRERINRALNEMKGEPLSGDVVPLRGPHQGSFRRRVGSWRIFFSLDLEHNLIAVQDIRRRTSATY